MAQIISWPNLTEFADGRVLGASALNDYSDAVNQLLAESLSPYSLDRIQDFAPTSSFTDYQVAGDWYQYHRSNTVYYRIYLKNESAIGTTYARFYYVNGAAETALGSELSAGGSSWSLLTGTLDISSLGLTVGQPYRLRLRIKGNNSSNRPSSQVWALGEQLTITGWSAPGIFTNGQTSHASHLNLWRDCLTKLHGIVSPVNPLMMCPTALSLQSSGSSQLYTGGAYRVRDGGHILYAALEIKTNGISTVTWKVDRYSDPGTSSTIYTSSALPNTYGAYTWYSTSISQSGLSTGAVYRYEIRATKASNDAEIKRAVLVRVPPSAPSGTWYTPAQFAHGNTAISAATMNAISADINRFYTGGADELTGRVPAVGYLVSAASRNFSGVHRKRWLCYLGTSSDTITINYGLGYYSVVTNLPRQTYWQSFDLESAGVPLGVRYVVSGVASAFECDEAV